LDKTAVGFVKTGTTVTHVRQIEPLQSEIFPRDTKDTREKER
jgi:hypothetical protein